MKVQLFVLVCFIVSLASSQTITGVPNVICGEENVNISASGLTTESYISVTASVSSIGVSPAILILSPSVPDGTISISCNAITPVQFTFYNMNTSTTIGTFNAYCKGVMYIQNPISSIIRGNVFSTTVFLSPTPQSVVDIRVRIDNPIIVPGSDRLTFGIGQSTESEVFYVPAGEVGNVNISFASRSLRDYTGPNCEDLVLSIDVLGTITSDLEGKQLGEGIRTEVTVKIQPPALDTVVVTIDCSSIGVAFPSTLVFQPGQDTAYFDLLPKFDNTTSPASVTFKAEYYDTLVEYIFVIGTIFSSIPPVVSTGVVDDMHVAILPGAALTEVVVYLESSGNIKVPDSLVFAPGVSLVKFTLEGVAAGNAFVKFTAPGYTTLMENFKVVDLSCASGKTANILRTQCVNCPSINGNVCSSNGVCSYSTVNQYLARCVCNNGFVGAFCELNALYANEHEFTSAGAVFQFSFIPGVSNAVFTIPPALIEDNNPVNGGNGTLFIRDYDPSSPFPFAVDPNTVQPSMENFRVSTLPPGFGIDITYFDNTIYNSLLYPLTVTFFFDPLVITQTDFLEMELYYYNITAKEWVPSLSVCPPNKQVYSVDLIALEITTTLCAPGQYQFFAFIPIPPPLPAEPVYVPNTYSNHQNEYQFTTTGGTGVQQQLPPQPHLAPEVVNDPSPPRNIVFEEEQQNSAPLISYSLLPIFLVLSLFF